MKMVWLGRNAQQLYSDKGIIILNQSLPTPENEIKSVTVIYRNKPFSTTIGESIPSRWTKLQLLTPILCRYSSCGERDTLTALFLLEQWNDAVFILLDGPIGLKRSQSVVAYHIYRQHGFNTAHIRKARKLCASSDGRFAFEAQGFPMDAAAELPRSVDLNASLLSPKKEEAYG